MDPDHLHQKRRMLPHWQIGGSTYFITYKSLIGDLTHEEKLIAMATATHSVGTLFDLYIGVIMPDHVHLLLRPSECESNRYHELSQIMKSIKGISSRQLNALRGRTGPLWQGESYDRIIRSQKELEDTWQYIFNNPLTANLVQDPEEYPYYIP